MSKAEVTYKGAMELGRVIAYLERLKASLSEGKVCVQNGGEAVVLHPTPVMQVEVEASQKRGKERLTIELGWLTAEEESTLEISSQEPDVVAEPCAGEGEACGGEPAAAGSSAPELEPVGAAVGGGCCEGEHDHDHKKGKKKKDKDKDRDRGDERGE